MSVDFSFDIPDDVARNYEFRFVPAIMSHWTTRLLEAAGLQPGDTVLDAGCGTGIIARSLVRAHPELESVTGLDMSAAMLQVATSVAPSGIRWVQGDITALPFTSSTFDAVICQQVIQFVPDAAAAWGEFHRVLKPGGRLVVAALRSFDHSPGLDALARGLERHIGSEAAAAMRSPGTGGDLTTLRSAAEAAGFADVHVTIEIGHARFATIADMLQILPSSTPLGKAIAHVPDAARSAVAKDVHQELQDYLDDDGLTFPLETALVRAVR